VVTVALPCLAAPALATAGTVTLYPVDPYAGPHGIATGPDGNIWLAEEHSGNVGKIGPDGTVLAQYPSTYGSVRYIAAGPDGNMWFTEYGGIGAIGRVTVDGVMAEFPVPTHFNRPWAIAAGPDGNMWFTEDANNIGRITMSGQITEFPIPTKQAIPDHITRGPDGNMWFTESNTDKLASISPQGHIREFKLPPGSSPSGIVLGPDGNLWITEQSGPPGKIARVDVSGGKLRVKEFPLSDPSSMPYNIANGPDGNLWFTDVYANGSYGAIGRITPSGTITMFDFVPPRNKSFVDITAGPGDGKMWFGLYWSGDVGTITTS